MSIFASVTGMQWVCYGLIVYGVLLLFVLTFNRGAANTKDPDFDHDESPRYPAERTHSITVFQDS